ncbi:uncharacterized protein TRAVEDRAFT_48194 [Trametes versicolor FP-101664 SS1]|uniref:uncharacterized protein n=1 Tax=Trametes versicolor (strain FP-101664) TaxID=717944 RepID=UPI000462133E|nr:uncharacterized protein TRAVEDRAFT_48194 [Trametes versicolor FP-101664 SS1]EIW57143.1 hypothetical protein TRAVEDRAFT_48194 [Trametes versicolor FP-101664 SS1]
MPAVGTVDWSALFPAEPSVVAGTYTLLSSLCLFYYDFIITIPAEVRVFWKSRLSLASALYALARYGFLFNLTLVALFTVRFTQDSGPTNTVRRTYSCESFYTFAVLMNLLNFAKISASVATRMFAIWGRNWPLAISVFFLGLVNLNVVPVLLALHLRIVLAPWPIWRCEVFIPDDETETLALTVRNVPIVISAIGIAYELLCLVLTAWKTLSIYRAQRSHGRPATLTSLLLRDGSVYFLYVR